MNLTDQEILELNELCSALIDGRLDASQQAQLSKLLASSDEARKFYVRTMGQSASLYHYAGEMQADEMEVVPLPERSVLSDFRFWLGGLAIAASLVFVLWFGGLPKQGSVDEPKVEESVARLTGSKDCQWTSGVVNPNDLLLSGQRLELARGFAEILFDSGARVVVEGPASIEINSAWNATLRRGKLKANVPPEAVGFAISNPSVEVVDLGTEFTIIAYANGAADVLVSKGAIEATPQKTQNDQTIVLRENEARRFAADGSTSVSDGARMYAQTADAPSLDRIEPKTQYVHWSFDESGGDVLLASDRGTPLDYFNAYLHADPQAEATPARAEGHIRNALRLDGHRYAKAAYPGISGSTPHTIVFWVRVPEDAPLSYAYAIVAWDTTVRKMNSHPVHIGWNRNPNEGTVGVLRTDYGGGYALGTTSLRDGRWHHVAVVFVPGEDEKSAVEVNQYVDGRLEGVGKSSPRGVRKSPAMVSDESLTPKPDTVWFGRRLGHEGQRKGRFLGELDEMFIADQALGPTEIVQLMRDNKPLPAVDEAAVK